jgi:hypothetical protein
MKMTQYKLDFPTVEEAKARNAEITITRGYDGVDSVYYFLMDGKSLIVNDGDFQGLTLAEIQSLTPYEPEEQI